ncbi:DUF5677 domain-containing protein [Metabacillus fastidiosus]|uniref:DUF5677 domain-containing protein n=1 Tax=Metabacillus fastidiosus TaxID=1458 RepID=UPI002E21C735|nr:hypothetical protein [Metabacillus fastidiosus]
MKLINDKTIRETVELFLEEYINKDKVNIDISNSYISEFEELILEGRKDSNEIIKNKLESELSITYLYIIEIAVLSLAFNQDKEGFFSEIWNRINIREPNHTFESIYTNITNHALSVVLLVESGLDTSARSLLRVLIELTWISILTLADKEKLKIYQKTTDKDIEKTAWYNHFKPKKLSDGIMKLEKTLGIDDEEFLKYLDETRSEMYSFLSKYSHSSYTAVSIGAYTTSFSDEERIDSSLLGKESSTSISTITQLNEVLFYLSVMIEAIFTKIHKFSPPTENYLWKLYEGIRKGANSSYFYYLKKQEN